MHTFKVSREINHSVDTVWALLDAFADTHVYHPIVANSRSVNGMDTGLGAERMCSMYGGGDVQERITRYQPEQHRYLVEVFDTGPMPMTEMIVEVSAKAVGPNRTRVTYDGHFTPKFGPAGWLMAKTVMKRQFVGMMGKLIEGVDQHLATGRKVEKGGKLGMQIAQPAMRAA